MASKLEHRLDKLFQEWIKRQPSAFTRHQSAYLRSVADMVALRMSAAQL